MSRFFLISPLVLQTLIWVPARLIFKFFFRYEMRGLENLESIKGGVVFAMNHSSELDVFLVPSGLPFLSRFMPMFYTSREPSFYKRSGWRKIFYGGFFFNLWGAHRVHVGLNDYEEALKTHIWLLKEGKSINIFPEGKTTIDGTLGKGKPGAVYLADKANVPVVPIGVSGVFDVSLKEFFLRQRKVIVTFGKPLSASDLLDGKKEATHEDYKAAAERLMEKIESNIKIK